MNPSGRLIYTIAKNESDYDSSTQITQSLELDYSKGNYIDYKYFDKYNVTLRYEFGYGLPYTSFNYSSTATVTFELKRRDLSVWDVSAQNWKIEIGDYILYVGASSRDFKAQTTLTV